MTTVLPFSNNAIGVFAYEGFSYTISNPNLTYTLQTVTNSGGFGPSPSPLYFTKNANTSYTFAITDLSNNLTGGTTENFVLQTVSGSSILSSSNTVTIGPGRFLDGSGLTLSNNSYTFYKNEAITPIRLVAPSFTLKPPTSVPSLPPGLSFVSNASNIYDISGIPLVTVPNSNYQIIGLQNGGSRIVTTKFNIVISNERLQLNLSGSPIISGMTIGTPITPRVITVVPPVGSSAVQYTFPTLPDGIVASDSSGNTQVSPFTTTTAPYTFIVSGTPTSNAAYAFRAAGAGSNGLVYTVQASRISPSPLVQTTQPLTFSFAETILFDLSTIPILYTNVPVDSSANFFTAGTFFTSNVPITDISSTSLPDGLTLVFDASLSRARLTGIPTTAGSANYTIRATNSSVTRDYSTPISISNDSVSFSSPVGTDLCYSFILSRPVDISKNGYYPSNIQFSASAASGRAISFSAPAFSGTGLSLDSNGVITGLPSAVTPLTDLVVTATAVGTSVTATKTVKFSILDDVFTFADVSTSSLLFLQNRAITPFQFQVSTLSGRNVIDVTQSGFPAGLSINPAGVVSGTPLGDTSGNVIINATTGYSSGTRDFSYNVIPDTVIFRVPQGTYTYTAGDPVGSIDIDAVSYSGLTVSNFDLSLIPTYGLTVASSTGVVSGTWTTGIPPDVILPSLCNFTINAQAGGATSSLSTTFTASPTLERNMIFNVFSKDSIADDVPYKSSLIATSSANITSFQKIQGPTVQTLSEIRVKSTVDADFSGNVIVVTRSGTGTDALPYPFNPDGGVFRASNGSIEFTDISFNRVDDTNPSIVSSVINIAGTTKWRAGGRRGSFDNGAAVVFPSEDNGITWGVSSASVVTSPAGQIIRTRDDGSNINPYSLNPYLQGGLALKYSPDNSGILIAGGLEFGGGPTMAISLDQGASWRGDISGGFVKECSSFSLDNSSIWIATGSDAYRTIDESSGSTSWSSATNTIKYSTDYGSTWTVASGAFNMFAYEIVHGNATWLATGVQATTSGPFTYFAPELRYSTDGSNWAKIDLSSSDLFPTNDFSIFSVIPPLRIGSMAFDGNYWNVFVNAALQGSEAGSYPTLYRHDASTSLLSGWFAVDISSAMSNAVGGTNDSTRFLSLTPPTLLYTPFGFYPENPSITVNLTFNTEAGTGPVLTSPTTLSFLNYQYIPITPIQLSATGTGIVYFFVETVDLPDGLSFNPLTNQITGTSVRIGQDSLRITLKDSLGTSVYTLLFTTVVPRIIRKQDGAGAYTSLLRQYTEVLGAQAARDNRALPNQETRLGEFMSPEAPDVITQTVDPKCYSTSNCT